MKRTIYILVIFLTVFLINYISVDAGICDGLKGHKYCNVGSGLKFNEISFPRYAYYLPIGFNTSDSFDGNSDVAFCIDPGLSAATENYTFFRELDINSEYDKGLYSMYQFLVNSSRASESEGKDATIYRAFFEAAARIWTVKNGNYSYSADLEKNFARFINCSNSKIDTTLIDSLSSKMKTLISKYNWAYNDETDVFKVNNETLVKSYCFEKVKNGTWNTELLKKFYEKVNVSSVWEDPFEKKSSISINQIDTKNGSNYKITFTVKFGNFFDNGVGIDSLNLDAAKFTSYIYINNKKCDINNCSSEVVNISNNYNSNIITSGNKDLIYTI